MDIYVIRHGETAWNRQHLLQGRHGADLDEEGVLLAEMTSDALQDVPFDICYTSPLIRAKHTAQIMIRDRQIPVIEDERLAEISFGVWEGRSCAPENMEIPADEFQRFRKDSFSYVPPEGGESIREVIARCSAVFEELIHDPALADKTVLVSTHGCALRAFLHSLYENKADFWQGGVPMNCSVSLVHAENGRAELVMRDRAYYPKEYYRSFYGIDYTKRPAEREDGQ